MAGRVVGHAGQHQLALEGFLVVLRAAHVARLQHHVLVEQHLKPEAAQFVDPGMGARVVLVVAGHHEGAVARAQPGQRRDVLAQFGTLPSTRSPVIAIASAPSRFTASTMRWM